MTMDITSLQLIRMNRSRTKKDHLLYYRSTSKAELVKVNSLYHIACILQILGLQAFVSHHVLQSTTGKSLHRRCIQCAGSYCIVWLIKIADFLNFNIPFWRCASLSKQFQEVAAFASKIYSESSRCLLCRPFYPTINPCKRTSIKAFNNNEISRSPFKTAEVDGRKSVLEILGNRNLYDYFQQFGKWD